MLTFLARNWWVLVLRGVAGVAFGVLTWIWPAISLAVLVIFWGAFAFVDGIFGLIGVARRSRADAFPWWLLVASIVAILAGIVTFVNPAITALALVYLIGAFAIVRGVSTIAAAIRLRKEIRNEWLLGLAGLVSIVFGVLIALFPGAGALAIVLWIGSALLVIGVLEIVAGIKLRSQLHHPGGGGAPAPRAA